MSRGDHRGADGSPTLNDALRHATKRLQEAGIETARLDAQVMLGEVLGVDRLTLLTDGDRILGAGEWQRFEVMTSRRASREPVAHIIGHREFWSLDFLVTSDTLIPRPDSETLVAELLKRIGGRNKPLRLLDFGTGTGCLLLSLLSEWPMAFGIGVDRSEGAIRVARENARRLGLLSRSAFVVSDWGRALSGTMDVVISNPPYISRAALAGLQPDVVDFEPETALLGGEDGLVAYREVIPAACRLLAPGGFLALEIGHDQGATVGALLAQNGFRESSLIQDLAGQDRVWIAQKNIK